MADAYTDQWRGSVVGLSPQTLYEVQVRFLDPQGVLVASLSASSRTRPDYPVIGTGGAIRYVPDHGSLQAVVQAAAPGDTHPHPRSALHVRSARHAGLGQPGPLRDDRRRARRPGHPRRLRAVGHDFDCDNLHDYQRGGVLVQWSDLGGPSGNGRYPDLAIFRASTGQEVNGISDTGTLLNPDFTLQAGSPEVDAGCLVEGFNDGGRWRYTGSSPDIGAFERPDVP